MDTGVCTNRSRYATGKAQDEHLVQEGFLFVCHGRYTYGHGHVWLVRGDRRARKQLRGTSELKAPARQRRPCTSRLDDPSRFIRAEPTKSVIVSRREKREMRRNAVWTRRDLLGREL